MRLLLLIIIFFSFSSCDKPQPKASAGSTPPNVTGTELRAVVIPKEFQHLLPLAQKWGIGDDIERGNLENKASAAEKQELLDAVRPYHQQINTWLDSFGNAAMTDEAAAFMYMLEAMEEIGI